MKLEVTFSELSETMQGFAPKVGEITVIHGKDGYTPVKGKDYFTAEDVAEIVAAVKASLTLETWTFTLEDGSTVTKKVLVDA